MRLLSVRVSESAELLLSGVTVVDPREQIDAPRDVLIRSGQIAELAEPGSLTADQDTEQIEAAGLHLFPGLVDPHVHLRTPGQEYKEDIASGTRAAAAGGYCQIVTMPNTDPVVDSAATVGALQEIAERDAVIPTGFTAAITRGLEGRDLTEMAELREQGVVGFTDDGRPVESAAVLLRALRYQRLCGGVIALHEEDPSLSAGGSMHEGEVSARLGITGIPSLSESTMVARDAALAEYAGAQIHVQHLSCVESVEAVAAAKERGIKISTEASPHHLLLTDEDVRSLNTSMKMNPPLRTERDRQALIEGLRSGVIECVATDHAPHARHEKEVPFEQAAMGTTGLESAFAVLYTELVLPGLLPLATLIERMTAGAAICGLPTPAITTGRPADLCLIDLAAEWSVGAGGYASKSTNCCFDGWTVTGRVKLTVAAGQIAYREALARDEDEVKV